MLRNAKCLLVVLALQGLSVFARGNSDGGDIDEALLFRREGDWLKFKVLVFGDLHYGEGHPLDPKSSTFQEHLLRLEAPVDLVVLNGDMSSNYKAPSYCRNAKNQHNPLIRDRCRAWQRARWSEYTAPLLKHKIPYALNLGNHDALDALDPTARDLLAHDLSANYPISRTKQGPANISRAANYFLPIYRHSAAESQAMAGVWVLDSGADGCMGSEGWGCVNPDQVAWFRDEAVNRGGVPSHMFVHIPVEETLSLWNRAQMSGPAHDRGHVSGSALDFVDCSALNTGLFAAISDSTLGVQGLWHGHDHNNDFFGEWAPPGGPWVGYGRKSGYGGYGGAIANKPGARVIEFSAPISGNGSDVEWATWVRLETGEFATHNRTTQKGSRRTSPSPPSLTSRPSSSDLQVLCGRIPITENERK